MQSIHRYGFAESIFRQVAFIETTRQRGSSAIFFPQKIVFGDQTVLRKRFGDYRERKKHIEFFDELE